MAINPNGSMGEEFTLQREVRQGCPLAPCLFLIIGEVPTHIIKKVVVEGRLREIILPKGEKTIEHYAIC